MSSSARKRIPDNYFELVATTGTFVNGADGKVYIAPASGAPPVELRSTRGQAYVLGVLGIGRGTPKLTALWCDIEDRVRRSMPRARIETTAAFDCDRRELRVNLGAGAVFFASPTEVHVEGALTDGLLFVDEPGFQPVAGNEVLTAWNEVDQINLPCFTRALLGSLPPSKDGTLEPDEQQAVVLAWWLGTFINDLAVARPILALIGPPACGKTVTGRLLGTGFYGTDYDVSGVAAGSRAEKDVAASLVERALVVRDDINSAPRGIMDLLCSAATGQKFDLSAFHETLAMVSYRPRAILALTAHTPKWALRGDVLSRLLVLRFERPPESIVTELDRKNLVMANRAGMWAETLRLLFHGVVAGDDRFEVYSRFPDWEMIVRRALRAVGREQALVSALWKMRRSRVDMAAEAEPILGALEAFAWQYGGTSDARPDGLWWTATEVHNRLAVLMGIEAYTEEGYPLQLVRSPAALGKFLAKLIGEGSAVVKVQRKRGHNNAWVYRISPKEHE